MLHAVGSCKNRGERKKFIHFCDIWTKLYEYLKYNLDLLFDGH